MQQKPSKIFVMNEILKLVKENPAIRILDVGSGQSKNFIPIFEKFPNLHYVGVELKKSEANVARSLLKSFPNAKIVNDLAYDAKLVEGEFDLVVSLSVLEHVKRLDKFLDFCSSKAKAGAKIIHLYDLGHALYPDSLLERFQIFLCCTPFICKLMPEKYFTAYLSDSKVIGLIEKTGLKIDKFTFHNMRSNVALLKGLNESVESHNLSDEVVRLEILASDQVKNWPELKRQKLFPSVCVWANK